MKKNALIIIVLLLVFLLLICWRPASKISLLLSAPADISWFYENRKAFKKLQIQGLVYKIADKSELTKAQRLNKKFQHSYLRIELAPNDGPAAPPWLDNLAWKKFYLSVDRQAALAQKAFFKGLVFDLTAGQKDLWDPFYDQRYENISDEAARNIVYQRGRQLAKTLEKYRNLNVFFMPLGLLWDPPEGQTTHQYYYWVQFLNGYLSLDNEMECNLIMTQAQELQTTADAQVLLEITKQRLRQQLDYPVIWQDRGTLSWAINPLQAQTMALQKELFELFNKKRGYLIINLQELKSESFDEVYTEQLFGILKP